MDRLRRRWRPLTPRHAEVLELYARAMRLVDERSTGSGPGTSKVARVRALAHRITQFVEEGRGGFGTADARLLTEIGEELVGIRSSLGDRPYLASELVKFRIQLGMDILGVRDRIQQFTRIWRI